MAHDTMPRAELLRLQRERLDGLLRHALARSPYYRAVVGPRAAGREPRLEDFPPLPKATLMREFDRVATDPRLRLEPLREHVRGPDPGRLFAGEFTVFTTSGTTGEPGIFAYSRSEWAVGTAAAFRVALRAGATPGTRVAGIGAPSPLHMSRRMFAALQSGHADAPQVSVVTPLEQTMRELERFQPELVTAYPSVLAELAQAQLDGRLTIAPSMLAVGSEVLTEDAEARIRAAWGHQPFDVYASTEGAIIASSSPAHVGLHASEDLLVLEPVDEAGDPVEPGELGHHVLVTNLVNHAQPLIRYELADSIVMTDEPDPSGRPYARILRVDGRADEILRLPGADGGEAAVHPYRLRAPFSTLPGVLQYQIRHRPGRLAVHVVPTGERVADLPAAVREAMAAALTACDAELPEIDVVLVDAIPREPGQGGKQKLVAALDG
jgi:phenylacetate-coenzyme A ligase PaaK-like adenylate-forming protein